MKSKMMTLMIAMTLTLTALAKAKETKTIKLREENTFTFGVQVDSGSVDFAINEIYKMDQNLPKGEPIYIALRTPGGSVFDGLRLIEFLRSLDRPFHTITFFAASMGYQIVQALNTRYVVASGVLMAHPASVTCRGNKYEIRQCLKRLEEVDNILLNETAERLNLPVKDYEKKIKNEWWIMGPTLEISGAIDEVIKVKCSKKLFKKVYTIVTKSFFGESEALVPACPLLEKPLELNK